MKKDQNQTRKGGKKAKTFSQIMNSIGGQVNSMFTQVSTIRGYQTYGR